jgi:DNA mismatch endonuclease, patch repair protein
MRAIRRTDTKPEVALRRALHQLGYRYRKDLRLDLDGGRRVRPDIAFTARKVAVFVDGCFWHACPEHGTKPRANEWYWGPKLTRNVERDRANDDALMLAGWSVIRLWEHIPLDEAVTAVVTALGPRSPEQSERSPAMRVFLASTLPALAAALQTGQIGPGPAFAVTPALREAYASGDAEELDYVALTEAARASLRLIAADPDAPPRRVVLAAEIPAEQVSWDASDDEPARVAVTQPVPVARLDAGHLDDPEAAPDVQKAAKALPAADAGDEDAQFTVDGAEGHELGWYATQELSFLVG